MKQSSRAAEGRACVVYIRAASGDGWNWAAGRPGRETDNADFSKHLRALHQCLEIESLGFIQDFHHLGYYSH